MSRLEAHEKARRLYATELACSHGHYGGDPGGICCSVCRPLLEAWDADHPEPVDVPVTAAILEPPPRPHPKPRRTANGIKPLSACMLDPKLFGKTFGGPTFAAWRAVAKMIDGLALDETELALWQQLSGRQTAPTEPFTECYLLKPRRAGGTLFAAALGLHAALQDHRRELGPGEVAVVGCIAADSRQAAQLLRYISGLIADSPAIAAKVTGRTRKTITFEHRMQIEIHIASFRSTRGYSFAAVIIDELAYLRDEFSASPDVELIRAVEPALSNLNGRLFGLSTPHVRRGHLFDMWQAHYSKDSDSVLVLQASCHAQLNPRISQSIIDKAMAKDPEAARAEWFGEFRSDVSQWLPEELIAAALEERTGGRKLGSVAFVDMSGGRHDASVLAVAHGEDVSKSFGQRVPPRLVLDVLEHVKAPHEPAAVVERFAEVLKERGVRKAIGDRYAGAWVPNAFQKFGISYEPSELDKSSIYMEVLPSFAERRVTLLDDKRLIAELRMLERKPRSGGKADQVDHPPNGRDDAANAVCGALWLAGICPPPMNISDAAIEAFNDPENWGNDPYARGSF